MHNRAVISISASPPHRSWIRSFHMSQLSFERSLLFASEDQVGSTKRCHMQEKPHNHVHPFQHHVHNSIALIHHPSPTIPHPASHKSTHLQPSYASPPPPPPPRTMNPSHGPYWSPTWWAASRTDAALLLAARSARRYAGIWLRAGLWQLGGLFLDGYEEGEESERERGGVGWSGRGTWLEVRGLFAAPWVGTRWQYMGWLWSRGLLRKLCMYSWGLTTLCCVLLFFSPIRPRTPGAFFSLN